jgi:hypothetical protein
VKNKHRSKSSTKAVSTVVSTEHLGESTSLRELLDGHNIIRLEVLIASETVPVSDNIYLQVFTLNAQSADKRPDDTDSIVGLLDDLQADLNDPAILGIVSTDIDGAEALLIAADAAEEQRAKIARLILEDRKHRLVN